MQTFDTSHNYDRVSFKLSGPELIITRLPFGIRDKKLLIIIYNEADCEVQRTTYEYSKSDRITLKPVPEGKYYLNVYIGNKSYLSTEYYAYFQPRSISLLVKNDRWHFIVSPIINRNREVIAKLLTDDKALAYYIMPSKSIESDAAEIQSLAKEIGKYRITQMQKLLAIHDWVAENIYYDFDALLNRTCDEQEYSALQVLATKRCVCRGYANLGVALMRALGIPAIIQRCYALNIDTDGGWEKPENQIARANHVLVLAYVEHRWLNIDITWDSCNVYKGGKFIKNSRGFTSRRYFDATLEMISNTHKFQ